jgi:hypothetical protein
MHLLEVFRLAASHRRVVLVSTLMLTDGEQHHRPLPQKTVERSNPLTAPPLRGCESPIINNPKVCHESTGKIVIRIRPSLPPAVY